MQKKINILHINCNYMTTKLHQIMIRHLDSVNNIVFAPISKSSKTLVEPDNNVIVSRCFNKIDRVLYFYKQTKIYKSLINSIKNLKRINCIHAYTLFTDGNIAYKLYKKYGIPYVVAVRDTDVNTFYKYRYYLKKRGTKILRNAKKIFFLSPAYKSQVINKYVPKKYRDIILQKSIIIPNGIDDFWLSNIYNNKNLYDAKSRFKSKKVKLLFVGQIIKRKNIGLILSAIQKLKDDNWNISFDVIGKVNDQKLFDKLKRNNSFNYLGEKGKEDLINEYRNHDIFIMPSKTETFGLVYAEAMSQGLPVIYSANQGFDNQFPNGTVGFSVSTKETKDCVSSIIKIVKKYKFFYKNCIDMVTKYNWNIICNQYFDIYNSIVNKGE